MSVFPTGRPRPRRRRTALILATVAAATAALLTPSLAQAAADPSTLSLAETTAVGVHNTYGQAGFPYLADALDAGSSLIELDTWTDFFTDEWKVSHSSPFGNSNNCVDASTPAQLYTGSANKDLGSCLDDIRVWFQAHPNHAPIMIKIEMKMGFSTTTGLGPAQLDALIKAHLGSMVYRPADLLAKPGGGTYATLDAAAQANNWPTRAALAGKVIIEAIPGTVEEADPGNSKMTDTVYADYLKGLAASGQIGNAEIFPSVLNAQAGDPRTRYPDVTIRPWFVVFDGDASAFVDGGIDTSWYDTNHYLLVMTDAENVTPTLSDTAPTQADAQARVLELAADHASFVSCDWTGLPAVLSIITDRGTDG
ncbi:MAG TPA: phosphatidylinositol-specific phospholipase C domain-containing protein [Actinocrinis sp.]|nr:phosphatidylinositol-specific phospholipase C domain-containing protein [Actinocrinis sp.]